MDLLPENRSADCRQAILRKLGANATSPDVLAQVYNVWKAQNDPLFDEHDYMEMAYRLAITHPGQWQDILSRQRRLLKTELLREELDFVGRACTPDGIAQRNLYNSLLQANPRQHEPWALHALSLLCADIRETGSNAFISSSLNSLAFLQQTSDIFFTGNWLTTLLSRRKSREAEREVDAFLKKHPTMEESLRNKILVASWPLKNHHKMERKQK
jgi:aminopeptidase N